MVVGEILGICFKLSHSIVEQKASLFLRKQKYLQSLTLRAPV
jgi:hypothetical protein